MRRLRVWHRRLSLLVPDWRHFFFLLISSHLLFNLFDLIVKFILLIHFFVRGEPILFFTVSIFVQDKVLVFLPLISLRNQTIFQILFCSILCLLAHFVKFLELLNDLRILCVDYINLAHASKRSVLNAGTEKFELFRKLVFSHFRRQLPVWCFSVRLLLMLPSWRDGRSLDGVVFVFYNGCHQLVEFSLICLTTKGSHLTASDFHLSFIIRIDPNLIFMEIFFRSSLGDLCAIPDSIM